MCAYTYRSTCTHIYLLIVFLISWWTFKNFQDLKQSVTSIRLSMATFQIASNSPFLPTAAIVSSPVQVEIAETPGLRPPLSPSHLDSPHSLYPLLVSGLPRTKSGATMWRSIRTPGLCKPGPITPLPGNLRIPEWRLYGCPGLIEESRRKIFFNTLQFNVTAAIQIKTGKRGFVNKMQF